MGNLTRYMEGLFDSDDSETNADGSVTGGKGKIMRKGSNIKWVGSPLLTDFVKAAKVARE
jgi:hypothetical protein